MVHNLCEMHDLTFLFNVHIEVVNNISIPINTQVGLLKLNCMSVGYVEKAKHEIMHASAYHVAK